MIRSLDSDRACSLGNRSYVVKQRPADLAPARLKLEETLVGPSGIQPRLRAYRLHIQAASINRANVRNRLDAELRSLVQGNYGEKENDTIISDWDAVRSDHHGCGRVWAHNSG
jgi:hypothetical protein